MLHSAVREQSSQAARTFGALETLLQNPGVRRHASSIRHMVVTWVKDENRVNQLSIEKVVRPMVMYFDHAPKLQKLPETAKAQEKALAQVVSEKDISEHFADEGIRTMIGPCMAKVIRSLRYTKKELHALGRDDIRRLEGAIMAVRDHLHVEIPRVVAVKTAKDEDRESGFNRA